MANLSASWPGDSAGRGGPGRRGPAGRGRRSGWVRPPAPTLDPEAWTSSRVWAPTRSVDPHHTAQRLGRTLRADYRGPGARDRPMLVRHRRQCEHRRRRPDPRAPTSAAPTALAPRGRRLWRPARRVPLRAGRSPRAGPGRLACGGPAQVALRAARGRCVLVREPRPRRDLWLPPAYYRFETGEEGRRSTTTSWGCRTAAASAPSRCGSGSGRRAARATSG
jgi:hypothetical protein